MKVMPNTNLSEEFCDYLLLDCRFDIGGEAIICKNDDTNTLYKIFVYPGSDIPDIMSDNKFKKIVALYQKKLKYKVQPLSTLSLNGKLIGYEMSYDSKDISMFNLNLTRRQKLYYLRQAKEALDYFSSVDITYGDVKSDNILINQKTKKITFCDIDNIRLGQYPIDVMGHELTEYVESRGQVDKTIDAFMHNLLTLEQLNFPNLSQQEILAYLNQGINIKQLPDKAIQIAKSLTEPSTYEGEFMIQYIKK